MTEPNESKPVDQSAEDDPGKSPSDENKDSSAAQPVETGPEDRAVSSPDDYEKD